ncbi:hypothetical protein K474DRAFT_1680796, partial [Panus rudis PR-1116 ss-1]
MSALTANPPLFHRFVYEDNVEKCKEIDKDYDLSQTKTGQYRKNRLPILVMYDYSQCAALHPMLLGLVNDVVELAKKDDPKEIAKTLLDPSFRSDLQTHFNAFNFYPVWNGVQPGIYTTYQIAKNQIALLPDKQRAYCRCDDFRWALLYMLTRSEVRYNGDPSTIAGLIASDPTINPNRPPSPPPASDEVQAREPSPGPTPVEVRSTSPSKSSISAHSRTLSSASSSIASSRTSSRASRAEQTPSRTSNRAPHVEQTPTNSRRARQDTDTLNMRAVEEELSAVEVGTTRSGHRSARSNHAGQAAPVRLRLQQQFADGQAPGGVVPFYSYIREIWGITGTAQSAQDFFGGIYISLGSKADKYVMAQGYTPDAVRLMHQFYVTKPTGDAFVEALAQLGTHPPLPSILRTLMARIQSAAKRYNVRNRKAALNLNRRIRKIKDVRVPIPRRALLPSEVAARNAKQQIKKRKYKAALAQARDKLEKIAEEL